MEGVEYRFEKCPLQSRYVYSNVLRISAMVNFASVLSSTSTPGASSVSVSLPFARSTWKTHYDQVSSTQFNMTSGHTRSVIMVLMTLAPVRGRLHFCTIFGEPSLATWLVATTILVLAGFEIKSIAPPMPLKTLPGIIVWCWLC